MLSRLFLSSLRMSGKSFTPRMRLKVCIPVTENSKRQRSVFPSGQALLKALYLATFEATKKWTQPIHNWGQPYGQMCIMYESRLPLFAFPRGLCQFTVSSCAFTLNRVLKCIINSFRNASALSIVLIPKYRKIYGKRPCKVCVGRQRNECERCSSFSVLLKFSCCKLAVNLICFLL